MIKNKKRTCKAVSMVLAAGILVSIPQVNAQAAVITSNATDKLAVVFQEGTEYSAGDYVIYDGEMYICTEDTGGAWSQAETNFMQITKNKELGRTEDLSAAYEDTKDPSEEKSLMAFAANAWQKLKVFLGIGSEQSEIQDETQYTNATISQKLNYLGRQNRLHRDNLNELDEWVKNSFRSVSNGKKSIADAITDNNGSAGPQDTFENLSQAVRDMAQAKYQQGHDTGYDKGNKDGYSSGNKDGYDKGSSDGYLQGIDFADKRVNVDSASYAEGKKDGQNESGLKYWTMDVCLTYDGPDNSCPPELENSFYYGPGISENHRSWNFEHDIGPCTIYGISATAFSRNLFGSDGFREVNVKSGSGYEKMSEGDMCEFSFENGRIALRGMNMNVLYKDTYIMLHVAVVYV